MKPSNFCWYKQEKYLNCLEPFASDDIEYNLRMVVDE